MQSFSYGERRQEKLQNKHPILLAASYFLSEVLLIFLITLPNLNGYFHGIPYWSYFSLACFICIAFSIYATYLSRLLPYLLTLPFLFTVFYVFGYPLFLSFLYTGLFTWRYLVIQKRATGNHEMNYLIFTIILAVPLFLFIKDYRILVCVILQLLIILSGHFSAHAVMIPKVQRKQIPVTVGIYFITLLGLGALILYLLQFAVFKVAGSLLDFTFLILGKFVGLFEFLEDIPPRGSHAEVLQEVEGDEKEELGVSFLEEIAAFVVGYTGLTIVIAICIITALLFLLLKKPWYFSRMGTSRAESYIQSIEKVSPDNLVTFNLKNYFSKPKHPARKMVYDFERKAAKSHKGREPFESLEEWFERIGLESNLSIYQKVRYGNDEITDQELSVLQAQLREMMKVLVE